MTERLSIATPDAQVEIAPTLGASVLRYDISDDRKVFRTAPEGCEDPFATGCFLMAPWCNRIAGGVTMDGTFIPVSRNREDQALPIHGSLATARFDVLERSPTKARLSARITGPEPFDYSAHVTYALQGAVLTASLAVRHEGEGTVPYGLGLHPWFPRHGQVDVQAMATHYDETDKDLLPIGAHKVTTKPAWDFNTPRALPPDLIDSGFAGWDGTARLRDAANRGLDITTDPPCGWYQVYSPGAEADFFCFEPVSHPINAHNRPGHPGLVPLGRGESTSLTTRFIPV